MTTRYPYLLLLLLCPLLSLSQVLIKNTNVIDVEKKKILSGYDVVAQDGKITWVGKGVTFKLPPGTEVIDGSNKYLSPGFTDAHVHFFQSGGLFTRPDGIDLRKYKPYDKEIGWVHEHMEEFLRRYTRAGITSVIDVGSTYNFLAQRDSFLTKTYAPLIYMTGPLLTTWEPEPYKKLDKDEPFILMKSEEDARKGVRDQLAYKPDFIKIWYIVLDKDKEAGARKNLPMVQAVIDEAHKHNLRVAVHATERITAQLSVEAGADFLVHNVEDEIVSNEFVQLLKKKKTVICPTMVVAGNYEKVFSDSYRFSTTELNTANATQVASVIDYPYPDTTVARAYKKYSTAATYIQQARHEDSVRAVNLKKLSDAGVIIATGTDAGNIGTQHVSSFYIELEAMQQAGLDLWQLLQASTINGAKAVNKQDQWGSIAKGKTANMVLLRSNPLDKLSNWLEVETVISKGVVVRPDSLLIPAPAELAQQQLNAYNAHDLEAFLAPYAEDVEIYRFPNTLAVKGKEAMRKEYTFITQQPGLYCRLLNRIVQGNMVIDHEEILGVPGAPHYGVAIYEIKNGKISKVYFPQ